MIKSNNCLVSVFVGVPLATRFFLDINSTPELVDEIVPGDEAVGNEEIDAMAQDEEDIVPAQDEEDNAPIEATGTTYILKN